MTPLVVITNRGSTRNLRGDRWVDPLLAAEANVTHIAVGRADEIAPAVARSAALGAGTIIVNGGDGTAGLVFAALLNGDAYTKMPALALLPAGKTNMTGAVWSLKGTPEDGLAAVLRSRREGTLEHHLVTRPVLTLRRSETAAPLYGAFFGAAEVVEGMHFCRKHIYPLKMPNSLSHTAAVAILLWRALRSGGGTSSALAIRDDTGVVEDGKFFAVGVTALDELLLGVRLVPDAGSHDAPLHYVSLRRGAGAILRVLPDLTHRRLAPGNGCTVRRLNQVRLSFDGAYTLDGEIYEATAAQPLILEGDRHLTFVRLPA